MIDLTKEIKRESLRRKREREVFRQKVLLIMGTVVIVLVTTLSHILFASAKSVEAITIEELKIEEIPVQKWTPVEKHIALLFGYGYNDKAFVDSICSKLAEEYGLEKENGFVIDFDTIDKIIENVITVALRRFK